MILHQNPLAQLSGNKKFFDTIFILFYFYIINIFKLFMSKKISKFKININKSLYDFINLEVLPGTNIDENNFWKGFSDLINDLLPINEKLLKKRKHIQKQINDWHNKYLASEHNSVLYEQFLRDINYLIPEGPDFKIDTTNIDPEISHVSGPQLVVPITNSRYSLNAVNSRWGSLYDAIYGTDVLGSLPQKDSYDKNRGDKVIEYAKSHLDKFAPINDANWNQITEIRLENNNLKFFLTQNSFSLLSNINQIVGYKLDRYKRISELVLAKNNLHCRIIFNPNNLIGKNDPANISDVILESAVSAILDCEDSVATVDTEDKIIAYRNWLGLMKGDLNSEFIKNKQTIKRKLNEDLEFLNLFNKKFFLKGRALMLIRNVGHLMTTPSITQDNGKEIGEGLMDAMITSLIAIHDLKKKNGIRNSHFGSIYIVKPKMHGPEEVEFTSKLFGYVEKILNLPFNTIKVGIMDEERRTSVNLKECIRAAKSRVAFINTGFLDRTGDEIHTSMHAGPFMKKGDMKNCDWIKAYEDRNVKIGLSCGLMGRAQIGKGMWAMPDLMSLMVSQKINHPKAGANCAWVPSPTAATLHAMHYHNVDVKEVQNQIIKDVENNSLNNLLKLPLLHGKNLSEDEITSEIENNVQGILGYVVRWIDQGIGCSKVPDINNIGLMEDRATCRISSQALCNWLLHKIISEEQILNAFKKMAKTVDIQNRNDSKYKPMSNFSDNIAFQTACDLVFKGIVQPSGYTEPILHKRRTEFKNS